MKVLLLCLVAFCCSNSMGQETTQLFPKTLSKGFIAIPKNGKWGIMSKDSTYLTPIIYKKIGRFDNDGIGAIIDTFDRIALIDTNGNFILPFKYFWYSTISYGFGSGSGAICPLFSDGLLAVVDTGCVTEKHLLFVDKKGEAVLGPYPFFSSSFDSPWLADEDIRFDCLYCNYFSKGYAQVRYSQYGFITIDKRGDTLIIGYTNPYENGFFIRQSCPPEYSNSSSPNLVSRKRMVRSFFWGAIVIKGKWRRMQSFCDSFYIHNVKGKQIFSGYRQDAYYSDGLIIVSGNPKPTRRSSQAEYPTYTYLNMGIDTTGRILFKKRLRNERVAFTNGKAYVTKPNGREYLMDKNGKRVKVIKKISHLETVNNSKKIE